MAIGSLIVKLQMATGEFETDTKRAAKIAEKRAKEIDEAFRKVGAGIGIAIGAAVTAIGVGVAKAIGEVDKLNDMSVKFGIDLKDLQELKFIAAQTGTDVDTLGKGVQRMAKVMSAELGGASTAFDKLGLSVKGVDGNLKSTTDILPEIANKFAAMQDPMQKAALAQELFGKSGVDLIPMLEQGGAGLAQLKDRAQELGLVLSDEVVGAIASFDDKLQELNAVSDAFFGKLAGEVAPILEELISDFIEWATQGDVLQDIIDICTTAVEAFDASLRAVVGAGEAVTAVLGQLSDAFGSTGQRAYSVSEDIAQAVSKIVTVVRVAAAAIEGLGYGAAAVMALATGDREGYLLYNKRFKDAQGKGDQAFAQHDLVQQDARFAFFNSGSGGGSAPKPTGGGFNVGGGGGRAKPSPAPRKSGGGGIDRAAQEAERARQMLEREINETRKAMADWAHEQEYFGGEIAGAWEKSVQKTAEQVAELRKLGADAKFIAEYEAAALKQRQFEKTQAQTRQQQPNWDLVKSMEDERNALYLTNEQIAINNNLARLNEHATDAQKNAVIDLTKELVHLTEMRQLADSFGNSMMSAFDAIIDGSKSASQAFGDMLQDMSKMIMRFMAQKAVEHLVNMIFSKFTGVGNFSVANSALANGSAEFATGGYTGDGGKYQPAGIVHAGEYVINAESTKKLGLPLLNRLNGYSSGGIVTPFAGPAPSGGGMNLKVVINNNNNSQVSQQVTTGPDGMRQLEIFIDSRVRKTVGGDIASGEGLGKMFKQMGVAPQGVR